MEAPFVCKGCGAPRHYITQYCPICESSGPHIPASTDHKKKDNRAGISAAKRRVEYTDTFEVDIEYSKPRKEKVRVVKEPKPEKIRPPREVKRVEYAEEETEGKEKKKPVTFSFPKTSTLLGIFFVLLGVLIVLVVADKMNSAANPAPGKPNAVSTNQNNGTPATNNTQASAGSNTSSGNTSSSSAPGTPVTTPTDNATKPSIATVTAPAKYTTIPNLVGTKPQVVPTDTSVTLAWETNKKSNSTIKYGQTKACEYPGPNEPGFKTEHSIYIADLSPDTLYYYQIQFSDEAGNPGLLIADSFKTEMKTGAAPYVGSRAPGFTLRTLDGTTVSLNQFRGKKVILNFWASWCTPCKIELPHLQEIWEKYKNSSDVTVLTVAGSESVESDIRSYISSKGYTFPVCLDETESTFNGYDLTSIPKTFFIDKNGVIKKVQLGMFTSPGEIEFMLTSY
jgi:peroxiredoxin